MQDRPAPRNRNPQFDLVLQRRVQGLDPKQPMDDVDLALRRYRFHAPNVLEEEIVSDESVVPQRLHRARGILDICHNVVLPVEGRSHGSHPHPWYLRRSYNLCVPDQVRLYFVDAILIC